jgi:RHS repeat-associated protein
VGVGALASVTVLVASPVRADAYPGWIEFPGSSGAIVPEVLPAKGAVTFPSGYVKGMICRTSISNAGKPSLAVSSGAVVWTRCYVQPTSTTEDGTYSGYSLVDADQNWDPENMSPWGGGAGWGASSCVNQAGHAPSLGRLEVKCTVGTGTYLGVSGSEGRPLRPYVADHHRAAANRVRLTSWAQYANDDYSRVTVGGGGLREDIVLPPHPWNEAYWFGSTPMPPPWPEWWPVGAQTLGSSDATPDWPVADDSAPSKDELLGANDALRNLRLLQQCACDPVDTLTGNFHMPVPGVSVPGRGMGLFVDVAYNSLSASRDTGVGWGWSTSLGVRLESSFATNVKTVVQESGATVPFDPDGSGGWKAPDRFIATLVADGSDFVFTRNHFEHFRFDATGRLVSMWDQFGNTTTLTYPNGTSREASAMTDAGGRSLSITWSNGRLYRVTEPLITGQAAARYAEFGYDATTGELTSFRDVSGGVWTFGYGPGHRLTTMRKPRHQPSGPVVENHYDAKGRVDWQKDELGRQTLLSYEDAAVGGTKVTRPNGRVSVYRYSGMRREETIEGYGTSDATSTKITFDPVTYAVTSTLDGAGKITTFADPGGDGNVDAIEDPTGRITRFTYNALDQVLDTKVGEIRTGPSSTSTADVVTSRNEYDAGTARLEKTTVAFGTPAAAVTDYVYGDTSHSEDLTSVIDARTKTWVFTYEPATGYQISARDPELNKTTTAFNEVGWPTAKTSARGVATTAVAHDFETTYSYDLANRTTIVTGPTGDVVRTRLDANGNTEAVTELRPGTPPVEDSTTYGYTAADELETVTFPGGAHRSYHYRTDGLVDLFTNEANATYQYSYDGAGRLDTETDPLGRATTYDYDSAGRLATAKQPVPSATCVAPKVGCVTYGYDDAGRPTGIDYSDTATPDMTAISYDALGRRIAATSGGVTEQWGWNQRSQLTSHTDANARTSIFGWDGTGNLTTVRYPGTTADVVRTFDGAGRLATVKDWSNRTITFGYDADSNWTSTSFPGSTGTANTDQFGYDDAGRMTAATWRQGGPTGTILGSETYTRPAATKGMVQATTRTGTAGSTAGTNSYDPRNRLTGDSTQAFGYDDASNLTSVTTGSDGRLQVFDPAQQLCWTSPTATSGACATPAPDATTYTYDALGNRTSSTTEDNAVRTLAYNQANRLKTVTETTDTSPAPLSAMTGEAIVGNFDGDGEDDVFFYRPGGTNDDWAWWGTARNQFGSAADNYSVSGTFAPVSGDFDCDGFDDILWYKAGTGADHVWFWFGRYNGGYDSKQFTVDPTFTPLAGDFNADGCHDVFWYAAGSATDAIWWGDDDVAAANTTFDLGAASVSGTYQPVVGNFDGTGGDDIFWYAPGTAADSLWLFNTSGTYTGYSRTVNGTNYQLAAGDVNGDAKDDLLFYDPAGSDVLWWGASQASFGSTNQKALTIASGVTPVFGDFDGDTFDDLFLYKPAATGDDIWWGHTNFDPPTTATGFQNTATTLNASYRYGTDGLRAGKTVNSATEQQFTWSEGSGLPLLLAQHQGASSTYLLYGPGDQPVAQIAADGTATWFHHDQLGSVRTTTAGTTGAVASTRRFDAYGPTAAQTGTQPLLGYAGQYHDTETGYQYLRARYYDPATSQFLTRDPLNDQTRDPYGYTGGNPANRADPTGLEWWDPSDWSADDIWDSTGGKAATWIDDHRHGIIDFGTTIGGAVVAASCGLTVACVIAVGGVALTGTAAHLGWDALSDDDHDISPWAAASRGFINAGVGAACGWTFGQGCGPATLGRTTASRAAVPLTSRWMFRTEVSIASGRLVTGGFWVSTAVAEWVWRQAWGC